jgi:hypothetical protein
VRENWKIGGPAFRSNIKRKEPDWELWDSDLQKLDNSAVSRLGGSGWQA